MTADCTVAPAVSGRQPTIMSSDQPIRVLVVDDNRIYREAFRRNLMLNGYDVTEAEDTREALARLNDPDTAPEVVVTDLQMRTETEGLDLIRAVKAHDPLLPIIMISAVGSFEEGAAATRLGAAAVLSKARIEDEIERLYTAIETARTELVHARMLAATLDEARRALAGEAPGADRMSALESLKALVSDPAAPAYLRGEAFAVLNEDQATSLRAESMLAAEQAGAPVAALPEAALETAPLPGDSTAPAPPPREGFSPLNLESVESGLRRDIPGYDDFADDSKESLRIAEFLYDQQARVPGSIDFSRNIGFSYCFAVENEAKARMAKRLQKFLASEVTYALLGEIMERGGQNLSVYFHQHLLLLLRGREMDFTIDNVKQTFRRILEHQSRYKPDGLKALGIMILAFGRNYVWQKDKRTIRVVNPLGMKGLDAEAETLRFAELLISLQHYRNPYIHPEISDLEKLSKIRATTFECLEMASRLQ